MELSDKKEVLDMTTTAQKWGNSIGVRIPQRIAKKYGVENGSEIKVTEGKNCIILSPVKSKPTLDELLSQCTPENRHDEIDWGKPEGNEIW
ncbi:AbrB/MazE/SpoVT family DNA-binding domain-containing protein [Amphibacillus sp. Q70]|uniref:AbrB/MazE/SpoVT family DNA-binding domain-containing protein n=1 Tax=Amphibacillus sp. Q70 TaxID=3453416 RepID=UPI003F849FC5